MNKDEEIQELKNTINLKNEEIENLKTKLKDEIKNTDIQIKKLLDFEGQVSQAIKASEVIEKIKKKIELKGFLSDKELEPLLKEIEN